MINNRQNGRRRGRGGGAPRPNGGGGNPGNRIDNRARGNAHQLHEKYKGLARDMQMQGDRVMAEYYLQFADHYFRVLSENRPRYEDQQQRRDHFDASDDADGIEQEAGDAERGDDRRSSDERWRQHGQGHANGGPAEQADDDDYRPRRPRREARDDRAEEPRIEDEQAASREDRRPRRGRRPAPDADAPQGQGSDFDRLPVSILPPSVSAAEEPPAAEVEEKPRRRGRKPRSEGVAAEA